jgi:hypothetical protein
LVAAITAACEKGDEEAVKGSEKGEEEKGGGGVGTFLVRDGSMKAVRAVAAEEEERARRWRRRIIARRACRSSCKPRDPYLAQTTFSRRC